MPTELTTIDELREYLDGVTRRAEHHAKDVAEAVFVLVGPVIYFRDPETPLFVRAQGEDLGNLLRATIGGIEYFFSYNHDERCIEIRDRFRRGKAKRFSVDNDTSIGQVLSLLRELAKRSNERVAHPLKEKAE